MVYRKENGSLGACLSFLWGVGGIMSVKETFDENVRILLGDGRKVLFWKDKWVGNPTLAAQFPNLFACARDWLARRGLYGHGWRQYFAGHDF